MRAVTEAQRNKGDKCVVADVRLHIILTDPAWYMMLTDINDAVAWAMDENERASPVWKRFVPPQNGLS